MAKDVITRFKLETTQFDSKLRDSAKGLVSLTEQLSFAGKDFDRFAQKHVEAARALGNVQSGATNLKDKLKDLVGAYNDVARAYDKLSNEQKQGEFGKAMAESLTKLQGQIKQTKDELFNMDGSAKETGGIMSQLAQKFTINVDAIKLFQIGLKAANVALDTAKDAFFASESNVDAWGRTMASATSIYDSFLQTLNNGDFSGFFSGIDSVINKAKEAYNAMDELQTRMTIINPERAKLQRDQQKYRAIIRRKGKDSAEGKAATDALKALEPQLEEAYKVEASLNYNAFQKEVDRKLATAGIKLRKPSYDLLMRSFSSDEAYQKLRAGASGQAGHMEGGENGASSQRWVADSRNTNQKLLDLFTDEWRKQYSLYLTATYNAQGQAYGVQLQNSRYLKESGGGGGSTVKAASATTKLTEEEKEAARQAKALAEAEKKRAEQLNKLRAESADAVRNNSLRGALAAQKKIEQTGYTGDTSFPLTFTMTQDNVSALMNELKSRIAQSEIGSDMYNTLTERLQDVTSLSSLINYAMKNGIEGADLAEVSQAMWSQLLGTGDIPDEALQGFKDAIGESLGKGLKFDSEGNVKEEKKSGDETLKNIQQSVTRLSGVMSGVSTIGSGLQAMGIKLDEDVLNTIKGIQGAISVVQGVISIISAMSLPSETANTIATNANTVALGALTTAISTNSILHAIPGLARGGIVHAATGVVVPGNHYSGDLVPAMLNSGELVLSRSQQGILAAALEGGGMQNLHLSTQISAEEIRFILSAASSRQNNTEYLNFDFV